MPRTARRVEPLNQADKISPMPPLRLSNPSIQEEKSPAHTKTTNTLEQKNEQMQKVKTTTGIAAVALMFALAFKNGLSTGLNRIASAVTNVSTIIALPVTLFFPWILFRNEHKFLDGLSTPGGSSDDSIFGKMVNTGVSLGYAGVTFSEPLISASKSKPHLIASLVNLPHILFSFLTYTGGRLFGFLTAIKRNNAKGDPRKEFRLDQEFKALFTMGNLGSAQCSVIPMGNQCISGWETILDLVKGDFSQVVERFKSGPISCILGTLFNSWMFPFEWASKLLDTTIRTAEMTDVLQNLSSNPERSAFLKGLRVLRDGWHNKINNKNSILGKALHYGRELSKIEAVIIPPVGMMSVVLPTFNKFLRGEFFKSEAQEIGGLVGAFDKICGVSSFLMHAYYTGIYALTVRLPQFFTSAIFYGTSLYNWATGQKVNPNEVRDRIFHTKGSLIDRLSNWTEEKLNKGEQRLTGKNYIEEVNGKKVCKQIPNYVKVMLEESWQPAREGHLRYVSEKLGGQKPDKGTWRKYLFENKERIIQNSKNRLETYLRRSCLFDDEKIAYYKSKERYLDICREVEKCYEDEYNSTLFEAKEGDKDKKTVINDVEIPKSIWGLFKNPKALWEVLKMRYSFHTVNTILPLNIREFVNVVEYGDPNDKWWYQNHLKQESAIRGGDLEIANRQELMPVFAHVVDRAREALPLILGLFRGEFGRFLHSESAY